MLLLKQIFVYLSFETDLIKKEKNIKEKIENGNRWGL